MEEEITLEMATDFWKMTSGWKSSSKLNMQRNLYPKNLQVIVNCKCLISRTLDRLRNGGIRYHRKQS